MTGDVYLLGVDDTDAGSSIGTGALARELLLHLERHLQARPRGITRHQLLVHPEIPYTSHNSSACLELECQAEPGELAEVCQRFLEFLFHPGADPGLCVARRSQIAGALLEFGPRAQREILEMSAASEQARQAGIVLRELGGSGLGIIGALAACTLRAGGNDGRFIALGDIRELPDRLSVGELCRRTGIAAVLDETGRSLGDRDLVETHRWVRPTLRAGQIILEVKRCPEGSCYRVTGKVRGEND